MYQIVLEKLEKLRVHVYGRETANVSFKLRRSRKIKQAKKQLKTRLMDKNEAKNT